MRQLSGVGVAIAVGLVFSSCCMCVYLLELIIRELPGAGNLITLAQFLFISLEGFIFASRFCTKRRSVPLKNYLVLVIMFFLVSVSNNHALKYKISMPLHMIFKSGSLIANMALGILILQKRYNWSKYIAVGMITAGIATCTIASAQGDLEHGGSKGSDSDMMSWLFGISLLLFSLIAAARMGIYQETIFKRYGKHPREALFYCHALPLPGFLILYNDIKEHAIAFSASTPITVPLILMDVTIPRLWFFLILIAIAQYVCARSVFTLTTECSSLTVTLNPFTTFHFVGTSLVFLGTFLFADLIPFSYMRRPTHQD